MKAALRKKLATATDCPPSQGDMISSLMSWPVGLYYRKLKESRHCLFIALPCLGCDRQEAQMIICCSYLCKAPSEKFHNWRWSIAKWGSQQRQYQGQSRLRRPEENCPWRGRRPPPKASKEARILKKRFPCSVGSRVLLPSGKSRPRGC